jgi:hypothetical protein
MASHVQRYQVPGVPVTVFDTPGIELGKTKDDVIREYKKTIVDSRKGSPEDVIHAACYCIDGGQSRIQDFNLEIIRALANELPVIIVLTQCVDEERPAGLEHTLAQDALPVEGPPVRTLASAPDYREDASAYGLGGARGADKRHPPGGGETGVHQRPGCSDSTEGKPGPGNRRRVERRRGRRRRCPNPRAGRRPCSCPFSWGCSRASPRSSAST